MTFDNLICETHLKHQILNTELFLHKKIFLRNYLLFSLHLHGSIHKSLSEGLPDPNFPLSRVYTFGVPIPKGRSVETYHRDLPSDEVYSSPTLLLARFTRVT